MKIEFREDGEMLMVDVKNEQPTKSVKRPRAARRKKTATTKENKLLRTENMGGVQSQTQTDLPRSDKEIPGE